MLPFTHDQFIGVFEQYNRVTWPVPLAAYALAIATCVSLAFARRRAGPVALWGLAAMWAWTGIAYHWLFFSRINGAAFLFGAAFLAQAGLLGLAALRREIAFDPPPRPRDRVFGAALIAYAMVLYPVIGVLGGIRYPDAPVFGVTPCPVTLFTLGVLLLASARVRWVLLAVPVAWSLTGASAAVLLHIPQDWPLLLGWIPALVAALRRPDRAIAVR